MTEIVTYLAEDGKEFEKKEDCLEYERIKTHNTYKLYRSDYQSTTNISNADYVYLRTEDEKKCFILDCGDHYVSKGIDDVGFYIWKDWDNGWVKYDTFIEELIKAGAAMRSGAYDDN